MATGQLRLEVPTNPTQQLGADLPVQEASKSLAPEVHNDRTAHERLNISRVTSSPTGCKNLQAGSIVTTAQVHVQERESSQSDQQQGTSIKPSNTELLLSTSISIEVHNDIVHEGMHQQSTPILRSNLNTQGSNERLVMGFEAATGKMEDSWLLSLSITNNIDLGEALDLKTLDLMNPKDQYLNKPLLVGSPEYSFFIPQQERPFNSIMEISSGISKPQHDVVAMARSILTISPPETINREGKKMSFKSSSQAGYPSSEMEDLTRLHASLLNALHTSTTAFNMQSDKLALQMDLMNVMAIHIADINRKLDLLAIQPSEHISSQQQVFCNCGPVIDKLSIEARPSQKPEVRERALRPYRCLDGGSSAAPGAGNRPGHRLPPSLPPDRPLPEGENGANQHHGPEQQQEVARYRRRASQCLSNLPLSAGGDGIGDKRPHYQRSATDGYPHPPSLTCSREGPLRNDRGPGEDGEVRAEPELLYLRSKLIDLEDRSRRHNIRFLGFPEGIEGTDILSYLRDTLPKLADITFDPPLEFQRAHRLGLKRQNGKDRPRPIIACFLRHGQVRQLLQLSQRHGPLRLGPLEIRLSADFSKEIADRRRAFLSLCPRLRHLDVKFALFEPARMWITKNGESRTFYDPEDLKSFLEGLHDPTQPMESITQPPPRHTEPN
ncbi:hypothetical protein NDU88_007223 [Pleurodeles waltl]|uniref:Uncharacterized protein n=1 Tax=Pleurodeles waltl TaxID=8319 RepID=A0AAV7UQE7_PLEWA|nr:hypothetical protein NDU88_007223 [Pleurodeles waltl]